MLLYPREAQMSISWWKSFKILQIVRSQSAPVGPADDRPAAVVSKLQAIEGKTDSLNKKVVDTAESTTPLSYRATAKCWQ